MWMSFVLIIAGIAGIFYYASIGGLGEMPDLQVLENPKTSLASEVFSSDNKTLGKYYFNDNRTPVTFDELPKHLINALLAVEDIRYYTHSGIDWRSTLRAIIKLGKDGGGSTITQQLAKLLFTGEGSRDVLERINQKIKEYIISIRLERQYTKNEIIAQYLMLLPWCLNATTTGDSMSKLTAGFKCNELSVSLYAGTDFHMDSKAKLHGLTSNLANPHSGRI